MIGTDTILAIESLSHLLVIFKAPWCTPNAAKAEPAWLGICVILKIECALERSDVGVAAVLSMCVTGRFDSCALSTAPCSPSSNDIFGSASIRGLVDGTGAVAGRDGKAEVEVASGIVAG